MKIYAEKDNVKAVLVGPDDWALFASLWIKILEEEKSEALGDANNNNEKDWRFMLSLRDYQNFCLLDNNDIGLGHAFITNLDWDPEFSGLYILKDYRGRGYAHILYATMIEYMKEQNYTGNIYAEIEDENIPAQKAALRAGFYKASSKPQEDTKNLYLYKLKLMGQRPKLDLSAKSEP